MNIGTASGDINRFNRSLDTGINIRGPLASRDADQLGLAWNIAHVGHSYQQAQLANGTPAEHNEYNYELTYRAVLTDWLTLQPDVQYIVNPGTNPVLKNAWILGLHVEIGHSFGF